MGFDGFLVPEWSKPWVGWAVGSDWPEGDEDGCFRLADACAAKARQVARDGDEGPMRGRLTADEWDGKALEAFAEYVRTYVGGKQAQLVDRLVAAALEFNQMGVQVQYTKRMIEVSVWLLVLQLTWLFAAAAGPWGGLSLALVGGRVQIARLTIRQIAVRLLLNAMVFGGVMGGLDLAVQLSQSRRDEIDEGQVLMSAVAGGLTGGLLGLMGGGLSRLATSGLQAGIRRAEMSLLEKAVAASSRSIWGMMAQSGVANAGATAITLAATGDFSLRTVLQAGVSGVLGGADAHAAGWTRSWRGSVSPDPASGHVPGDAPSGGADGPAPHGADLANATTRSPDGPAAARREGSDVLDPEYLDQGSRLAASIATGERSSRSVGSHEIVRFGDGSLAVKKTGIDGDKLEAAALVRQAIGLDQPAVHRKGDVVYQRYGDERLQAAMASGIRESRIENVFAADREVVTFNDGTEAIRAWQDPSSLDEAEQRRLPPYRAAEGEGYVRSGPLVHYETRLTDSGTAATTGHPSDSAVRRTSRQFLDLLTLNESFQPHEVHTGWRRGTSLEFEGAEMMAQRNGGWNPLVEGRPDDSPGLRLKRNPYTPQELAALRPRMESLRPAFERLGHPEWHDGVMERFRLVERHAGGDTPMLGDLGAAPAARRPEQAPRLDEPDQRPGEALRGLFDGGRLHQVNDAIVHDTPDAAVARAHVDLAVTGLEELPSGLQGHVEARIPSDWLPADLAPGGRLTFPGVLEGVSNPRVLPEPPDTVHLVIRASDYVSTAGFLDRPHHATFRPDSSFKVLAVLESTAGEKTYFLLQDPGRTTAETPARGAPPVPAARPELSERLRRHLNNHRVPTDAGVWFRDPTSEADMARGTGAQAMPRWEGVFAVAAHGGPEGMRIGGDRISGEELHLLLWEDLSGRHGDDVIYLAPCEIGQMDAGPAQVLADRSRRIVIAADTNMVVSDHGDTWANSRPPDPLSSRGRLRIFLPGEPMTPDVPLSRIEQLLNHVEPDGGAFLLGGEGPVHASAEPSGGPPLSGLTAEGPMPALVDGLRIPGSDVSYTGPGRHVPLDAPFGARLVSPSFGDAVWGDIARELSAKETDAIHHYSAPAFGGRGYVGYAEINGFLRGHHRSAWLSAERAEIRAYIKHLNAAMHHRPLPETIDVFRKLNPSEGLFTVRIEDLPGTVQKEQGFLSTNIGMKPFWPGEIMLHLRVPEGTPAIYAEAVSKTGEFELLLPNGLPWYVEDAKLVDGRWLIHGWVLPDERGR
ncbi:ADP-ribosyltransferase [Nonomuraea sp. H19]|uniref:ADP-ribosyltransferase n=1 Tax=Nonomuraea sp. H19 TaxID=3452206 RepID=UPI003F890AA8